MIRHQEEEYKRANGVRKLKRKRVRKSWKEIVINAKFLNKVTERFPERKKKEKRRAKEEIKREIKRG